MTVPAHMATPFTGSLLRAAAASSPVAFGESRVSYFDLKNSVGRSGPSSPTTSPGTRPPYCWTAGAHAHSARGSLQPVLMRQREDAARKGQAGREQLFSKLPNELEDEQ